MSLADTSVSASLQCNSVIVVEDRDRNYLNPCLFYDYDLPATEVVVSHNYRIVVVRELTADDR